MTARGAGFIYGSCAGEMAETWLSSHRERKTFIWRWPSSGTGEGEHDCIGSPGH
uniref:Uncharacterized protein n=1 Tax=Anguilla anguilla TaxID=7936 RepID=A0A0E9QNE4_ANGAN